MKYIMIVIIYVTIAYAKTTYGTTLESYEAILWDQYWKRLVARKHLHFIFTYSMCKHMS